LFEPLCQEAIAEFSNGAGKELDDKMRAPHSSSALAVDVFHYWRYGEVDRVARACSVQRKGDSLRFEVTHRTPFGG
jgi:hypothetical protein